ncbi:MAG: N-methyl-L-tryptophan oxidase [Acidobacteria bacterium]|nr:N-methyl-L-tryptophan oxidase [Acidobacteriota bacterium]MYH21877.1 N-methyl-L-tryptophan oxidase [Acidobacteriota bacterium]MYK78580.1 N-methyl-L-tryptophan oxidase [Acidobacteriota bacterium]
MRSPPYDAIVIGVGGMGSAAVYHLAKGGARVLGLERFDIPHPFGSSHGLTRIIRLAYSEGSHYVPLLREAYRLWRELEELSGESILRVTGGLDIGPQSGGIVQGSLKSCTEHGLSFEQLDAAEVNRRFPGYELPAEMAAIHQPDAGYLHCETATSAHAAAARSLGADIATGVRVRGWDRIPGGVRVETEDACYEARKLVITAGPWAGELLPALGPLCRPVRQVMLWTDPLDPPAFAPERFPIFVLESPVGNFYGFPDNRGEGFKIGKFHHLRQQVPDPDAMDRECHLEDEAVLREGIEAFCPRANGPTRRMTACIFTNSPDGHFILDRHPDDENVCVAAGFSGHGFKFCGVVGRIMADFALERPQPWDLSPFGLKQHRPPRVAHAPPSS